jgi:hypothetical protein
MYTSWDFGDFDVFPEIYAEIYEAHHIAALAWSSLGKSTQIELALKDGRRKNCRDFLKVTRATYDSMLKSLPTLDQDVIAIFNKWFNEEYLDFFEARAARAYRPPAGPQSLIMFPVAKFMFPDGKLDDA